MICRQILPQAREWNWKLLLWIELSAPWRQRRDWLLTSLSFVVSLSLSLTLSCICDDGRLKTKSKVAGLGNWGRFRSINKRTSFVIVPTSFFTIYNNKINYEIGLKDGPSIGTFVFLFILFLFFCVCLDTIGVIVRMFRIIERTTGRLTQISVLPYRE